MGRFEPSRGVEWGSTLRIGGGTLPVDEGKSRPSGLSPVVFTVSLTLPVIFDYERREGL